MNAMWMKLYLLCQGVKDSCTSAGRKLAREERGGAEIIAAIILLAVVILLAVIFREKIQDLLNNIWGNVDGKVSQLGDEFNMP